MRCPTPRFSDRYARSPRIGAGGLLPAGRAQSWAAVAALFFAAACAMPTAARAQGLDLLWSGSVQVSQSGTYSFLISATNSGTSSISIAGINLGIQSIPQGGVLGNVTVTGIEVPTGSFWLDASTTFEDTPQTLLNGDVNNSSSYWQMSISDNGFEGAYGFIEAGGSADLAWITFVTDADAKGLWEFYAVSEKNPTTPNGLTYFLNPDSFSYDQFTNVNAEDQDPAVPGVSFQVSEAIAVPEPSSVLLACGGLLMAVAGPLWRQRIARRFRQRA